jgi:cytochrome b involved in lipid metabolism
VISRLPVSVQPPRGSKIILQLAGKDATKQYDPVHPPGTLEESLKPEAKLGKIDPDSAQA